MGSDIQYRQLARSEIDKLVEIDRTETIERIYYFREGTLVLEDERWDVPEWSAARKQQLIAHLRTVFDHEATIYGAFDGGLLVGMSVLDHNFVQTGERRLNLEGLWVSDQYRGQKIGKTLFQLAAQDARRRGAKALYVSATPSENTVGFYMYLGCCLTELVDPQLFEREPEDIHLELDL